MLLIAIWSIQIKCPRDYLQWQTVNYIYLFGTKWSKLHHGPMWSVVPTWQTQTVASLRVLKPLGLVTASIRTAVVLCTCIFCPCAWTLVAVGYLQANVNIPRVRESTIRRKIKNMDFTPDAQIQVFILTVFLNLVASNDLLITLLCSETNYTMLPSTVLLHTGG